MVLATVVTAKRRPSTIQPSTSMLMLITNSTPDTGRPSTLVDPQCDAGGAAGDQPRGHEEQHHRQRIERVAQQ